MRRTILIAIVTAVVAGGIAAGATVLLTNNDSVAVSSPAVTDMPTAPATAEPSTPAPSATASSAPSSSPSSTATAAATPGAGHGSTPPAIRSATSVNCDREENFCSEFYSTTRAGGQYKPHPVDCPCPSYQDVPTIAMHFEARKSDNTKASAGDTFASLHVEITVSNTTKKTFVFPKREIALVITKDNKPFDTLTTTGEGFDMTPGGKMTGNFDRPLTQDGEYGWQAKVWYYAK